MLKIVKNIFGIDPMEMVQGLRQTNPLEGGMFPDLTPKMMIGQGGLRNLEEAGMPQAVRAEDLMMADADLKELGVDQFGRSTDWLGKGIAIDTNADKSMYEIPDDAVRLLKGKDPEKIKGDIGFLELFKADLLENAYPDIGDIKLRFYNEKNSGTAGGYDPIKNILTINREHPAVKGTGLKKTILHEIQHFVQAKENMTYGDSFALRLTEEPDYVSGAAALKKSLDDNMVRNDIVKMLTENEGLGFTPTNVQLALKQLADNPTEDTDVVLTRAFGDKTLAEKFVSKAGAYRALRGVFDSKELAEDGYRKAFGKYLKTEGEAWARMTEQSADMTGGQRLTKLPTDRLDVPQEDLTTSRYQELNADKLKNLGSTDSMKPVLFTDNLLKQQSNRLKNPVKLQDGSRLSGFTSNTRTHFFGYDKNGEMFTIEAKYVNPADIVGSRDSDKTAARIAESLGDVYIPPEPVQFTDPMESSIQSSIPKGL
jgi:hypothetical protein